MFTTSGTRTNYRYGKTGWDNQEQRKCDSFHAASLDKIGDVFFLLPHASKILVRTGGVTSGGINWGQKEMCEEKMCDKSEGGRLETFLKLSSRTNRQIAFAKISIL